MGIFKKIFDALKKTKESISKKISALFTGGRIGDDFYEDIEDILISSDVSVKTSMQIVEDIKARAKEEKIKDENELIKLLKESLKNALDEAEVAEFTPPSVVMIIGVNGVGKTTTIGKLANHLKNKKMSVTIAAADTFRAAAADQLTVWADRAKCKIIKQNEGSDPSAVVYDAISSVKAKKTDVLLIDTAGRLHVKANLMEELKKMDRIVRREYSEANFYKMIVLDATTGQNALSQVQMFNDAVGIDGIIVTKLDGTAKGGFIISLCNELKIPVYFIGTGEKIDDIADFDSSDFIDAIL